MLAGVEDRALQASLFAKTLQFGWSVRQLEAAVKNAPEKKEKKQPVPLPVEYEELTERLRSATGLKVSLVGSEQKGKIVLEYASQEELQRLWDLMAERQEGHTDPPHFPAKAIDARRFAEYNDSGYASPPLTVGFFENDGCRGL